MNYLYCDIPDQFAGSIQHFDRPKARAYYKWFMSVKDERVKILETAVRTSGSFENWKADYSITSLTLLQKWLESVIEKRPFTQRESEILSKRFIGTMLETEADTDELPPWTLTEITESICHDVGIYFAEVLLRNNPSLKWGQNVRSKLYIDRNYPIVQGFRGMDFNPRIMREHALDYVNGDSIDLHKAYKEFVIYIKKS